MNYRQDPFIYGRAEFEPEAVFYMPENFVAWTSRKPQLFEGPRGSGKTSILKSLSWEVTWHTGQVQVKGPRDVQEVFIQPKHIGVYYRLEDMDLVYWNSWSTDPTSIARVFGTYMEFLWLDLLLEALQGIRKKQSARFSERSREEAFVESILRECFPQESGRPHLLDMSFGALQVLIKEIHMGVRDLVNRKQPEKGILSSFPIVGPGALVQAFGKYLRIHFSESKDWVLMLLLDDCNLLDDNLTKVVNSAVLKAKGIVAYKLTCLTGLYPTRRTLQKDRLVNEHDLETVPVFGGRDGIDMGSPADSKYLKVAEAVCRTKIESACGVQVAKKFDFKQFFGSFQLEDLLIAKLKASENPAAFDLLQMCNDAKQSTSKVSITKIWLHEKNIRKIQVSPASDKDNLWKRRSASIFTTKWKHVAAIAICREYKIAFPYSGWSVILHLSGGSIRELLRIMSKVWTLARVRPDDHSRLRPILPTAQAQAVVRAAEANYDAVDRKFISSEGATLQKMCDRLGSLFGKCQGFPYMIKAPETAAVQLPVRLLTGDESLNSIISEAVTSGVLLKRIQKDTACIGLHPVLAPKYGISFRSPFYYPQTVSISQLRHLVLGSDKDAQVVVREILEERLTRKHQPRNVQPTRSESKQQLELTIADDKD